MVNATLTKTDNPLRVLALSYIPAEAREGVRALFALDAALGNVVRTTREPMVGRMRLAWWREALERLDNASPPGEPVLRALADHVLRQGVTGAQLARLTTGWEWLLEAPLDLTALRMHAALRGEIFDMAGRLCGQPDTRRLALEGRGWVFADLAVNLSDADLKKRVRRKADLLLRARGRSWPRRLRGLGALVLLARADLAGKRNAMLVARLAWHRLTGR